MCCAIAISQTLPPSQLSFSHGHLPLPVTGRVTCHIASQLRAKTFKGDNRRSGTISLFLLPKRNNQSSTPAALRPDLTRPTFLNDVLVASHALVRCVCGPLGSTSANPRVGLGLRRVRGVCCASLGLVEVVRVATQGIFERDLLPLHLASHHVSISQGHHQ